MELPLELKYEVVRNMTVPEIRISYPHLLQSENVWKILFKRDFPLHTFVSSHWRENYEYYKNLQNFSRLFPGKKIQEEVLIFLKDFVDLDRFNDLLEDEKIVLDMNTMVYFGVNYEDEILADYVTELQYQATLQNYDKIDQLSKIPHLFYQDGKITREIRDDYTLALIASFISWNDFTLAPVYWNSIRDSTRRFLAKCFPDLDLSVAMKNIFYYGNSSLLNIVDGRPEVCPDIRNLLAKPNEGEDIGQLFTRLKNQLVKLGYDISH